MHERLLTASIQIGNAKDAGFIGANGGKLQAVTVRDQAKTAVLKALVAITSHSPLVGTFWVLESIIMWLQVRCVTCACCVLGVS